MSEGGGLGLRDVLVAVGLLLAIEGLLYAAFPNAMRRAIATVLETPDMPMRIGGLVAAIAGIALIWVVR